MEELPHASVAVQLRLMLYEPAHAPAVVTLDDESVKLLPHASVAVAVANEGTEGQSMVEAAGSDEMTGAVMS